MTYSNPVLWEPSTELQTHSQMARFLADVYDSGALAHQNYVTLHQWSINNPAMFWQNIAKIIPLTFDTPPETLYQPEWPFYRTQWFAGARLNFAQHLLQHATGTHSNASHIALIYCSERGDCESIRYDQLYDRVQQLVSYFKRLHIKPKDRIVGFLPNRIETVVAMLATTYCGAIWSACSCDMGLNALIDRFNQIQPVLLIAADHHFYHGRSFDHRDLLNALLTQLPSVKHVIRVPHGEQQESATKEDWHPKPPLHSYALYPEIVSSHAQHHDHTQTHATQHPDKSTPPHVMAPSFPFNHPTYILYSSGTTGKPKCMVHGAGGTLLQHGKELILHTNLTTNDRLCFFTTCGWMMWHWQISALMVGASIVLYEGSPLYPTPDTLFSWIDRLKITHFGIGAKFYESLANQNVRPIETHRLDSLKTLLTTGSPLLPTSFDYIYAHVKSDVQVSSISGGSDIISCFALGNPLLPVRRGELQCIGLGMDVQIFNDQGDSIINRPGELVCCNPCPSMPIYFWDDPKHQRYQQAYFERFNGVWAHGDYARRLPDGGLIIYGRCDTTLNPGGIRIGTAELYNVLERAVPEVRDAIAVGYQPSGQAETLVLFIQLSEGTQLTQPLIDKIRHALKTQASPHHVPHQIIQAPDLPRTINGKLMEGMVKDLIHQRSIRNQDTLANPDCLAFFRQAAQRLADSA